MSPGDIFRVNNLSTFDASLPRQAVVMMIGTRQRYWDYGDGECGYVDVADVMFNGRVFEIACAYLDPFDM